MSTPGSDGNLVFDPELLGQAEKTLAARPEQQARTIANGLVVDAAAFGTVPGASGASGRTTGWVTQTRTELGRVGAEVADLEVRTRDAGGMATRVNGDTQAAARLGSPN